MAGSSDDDDARAFEEAMRGARRLRGPRVPAPADGPRLAPAPAGPRAPAGPAFDVAVDGDAITGRARGVSVALVRRLRDGEPPIAARLDLHGRVLGDVGGALARFVAAARARGQRAGLVIHGRGRNSEAGAPVLRPAVWDWLASAAAARAGVMAFVTASPRDGGAGATVVLLRR
jgi:DNA-nicking Smr family endonuclease